MWPGGGSGGGGHAAEQRAAARASVKKRREAEGARGRGQGGGGGGERGEEEREQPVRLRPGEEKAGGGELGRHGDACHGVFGLLAVAGAEGGVNPMPRAWWTCGKRCGPAGSISATVGLGLGRLAEICGLAWPGRPTGTFTLRMTGRPDWTWESHVGVRRRTWPDVRSVPCRSCIDTYMYNISTVA